MEEMGTEAFAAVPFFLSGKAHGQERNPHLQSCSIPSCEAGVACPSSSEAFFSPRQVALFLVSCRCGLGLAARGYRNGLVPDESKRRSSFCFRVRLAASVFDVGEVIVLCVK